jgi:glycine/D-amino acid oxidase-like deaminating enzyme
MPANLQNPVPSLWQAISPQRSPAPALQGRREAEIVIIGAGMTGLSAGLHLAKRGRKVVVIEGATVGWGGSGRNNGQVIPVLAGAEPGAIETRYGQTGERLVTLIRDSADDLFQLARDENIECEAQQTGWFQPAHSRDHLAVSQWRYKAWEKRGAPVELVDAAACAKLLGSTAWHGGLLNPTGGHINPLMFVRGLAAACERAGGVIYEQSPVTSISRKGQRWQVKTGQAGIDCDAVLLATNAYSDALTKTVAPVLARTLVPVTSWQMATEPLSDGVLKTLLPGRQAVSDTRGDLRFFRLDARNQLITGGALMFQTKGASRLQRLASKRLADDFPQLGNITFSHIWSGYVGITPDHFPHFHQLGPGYWSAIGYNGRGVALSVSLGRELAGALDGENPKDLALPLSQPETIPFHAIGRKVARTVLGWYRWRDSRPPKL